MPFDEIVIPGSIRCFKTERRVFISHIFIMPALYDWLERNTA